jgi:hypothetical protein
MGEPDPVLTDHLMKWFGVTDFTGTPEDVMKRIMKAVAERGSQMTVPELQAKGQGIFSPDMLLWLHQGWPAVSGEIERQTPGAATQEQTDAARRLQGAINDLGNAWDTLVNKQIAAHPEWAATITWLHDELTALGDSKGGMDILTTAVEGLGIAFGITLVAGIAKAVIALNSFWAAPLIRFLVANPAVAVALAFLAGMRPYPTNEGEEEAIKRGLHAPGSQEEAERQRQEQLGGEGKQQYLIGPGSSWYNPFSWNWSALGGKRAQTAAGSAAGSNLTAGTAAALATIAKYESNSQNVRNSKYDAEHTASGYYQITDTNWRAYAPRSGIDTNKFPTAMSAPPELQAAVAALMYKEGGFSPWDSAHGGAMTLVRQAEARLLAARLAITRRAPSSLYIPGVKYPFPTIDPAYSEAPRMSPGHVNPPGWPFPKLSAVPSFPPGVWEVPQPFSSGSSTVHRSRWRENWEEFTRHLQPLTPFTPLPVPPPLVAPLHLGPAAPQSLDAIRGAQAMTINQSHHYDNDTNIGSIVVHTRATDGAGIAEEMSRQLRRNGLVSAANTATA